MAESKTTTMTDVWAMAPASPQPVPDYSGYPFWFGLLPEINRETQAADKLAKLNIFCYVPRYSKVIRARGGRSRRRWYAVIPGLIFVPVEFMSISHRDRVLDWAHIRRPHFIKSAGHVAVMTKADIERIRQMEAVLNLPSTAIAAANGKELKIGVPVRFLAGAFQWLGDGIVVDLANKDKIGVEVAQLFGARRVVNVPAREIEVM